MRDSQLIKDLLLSKSLLPDEAASIVMEVQLDIRGLLVEIRDSLEKLLKVNKRILKTLGGTEE